MSWSGLYALCVEVLYFMGIKTACIRYFYNFRHIYQSLRLGYIAATREAGAERVDECGNTHRPKHYLTYWSGKRMSMEHLNIKEYFDFTVDLMEDLHDAIALINSAHVDCLDEIELDLDESGHNAMRLLGMAARKLQDVVATLDQSSFVYATKTAANSAANEMAA